MICHFCQKKAEVKRIKTVGVDIDCGICGCLSVSGLFLECNNEETNADNWLAWSNFLRNRTPEEKKKTIIISTKNAYPPS